MRVNLDEFLLPRNFTEIGVGSLNTATYPPHNLIQLDETHFKIEVALVGFTKEDINLRLDDGKLYIECNIKQPEPESGVDVPYYWYRGIAKRKFRLVFRLLSTVVINSAKLDSGLLTIDLENIIPDNMKPKTIMIE